MQVTSHLNIIEPQYLFYLTGTLVSCATKRTACVVVMGREVVPWSWGPSFRDPQYCLAIAPVTLTSLRLMMP